MLQFFRLQTSSVKNDVLSGLTVALALVPEAIAFAFVAGVSPLIGLYSAFFIGLITAIFGGRPGMISGATGAMAVVVVALVARHGVEYLFPTVILCGLLQIGLGLARLGKLIRMVPHPVMLGFVNGLAVVIGLAQLGSFKTLGADRHLEFLSGPRLWLMLSMVALTMGIIWLLPKLTRAVPASLVAILGVSLIAFAINNSVSLPGAHPSDQKALATVGDMLRTNSLAVHSSSHHGASHGGTVQGSPAHGGASYTASMVRTSDTASSQEQADQSPAGISGGLPQLFFAQYQMIPMTWESLRIILPFAVVLCGVGIDRIVDDADVDRRDYGNARAR